MYSTTFNKARYFRTKVERSIMKTFRLYWVYYTANLEETSYKRNKSGASGNIKKEMKKSIHKKTQRQQVLTASVT
jgi:hypothetical protein